MDWTNFAILSFKLKRERKRGKCKNCRHQFFWIDLCEKLERVAHTEVRTKEQSKCRTVKRHSSFVTKIDTNYKITMRSKSTFNIVWPHGMSISVLLNQSFCILKNGCWLIHWNLSLHCYNMCMTRNSFTLKAGQNRRQFDNTTMKLSIDNVFYFCSIYIRNDIVRWSLRLDFWINIS